MSFKISAAPGGAATAAGSAYNDLIPGVDVSGGASDNANVYYTLAVLKNTLDRVRPTLDGMKTPPLASAIGSTWSWGNQSGASAAQDTSGALVLSKASQGSANDVSALYMTIPGGSWTAIMEFDLLEVLATGAAIIGMSLRESSTGKIIEWGNSSNNSKALGEIAGYYGTNYAMAGAGTAFTAVALTIQRFLKVVFNGTTYAFHSSGDGLNYFSLGSITKTTPFTTAADQIGPMINNYSTGSTASLIVRDFYIA